IAAFRCRGRMDQDVSTCRFHVEAVGATGSLLVETPQAATLDVTVDEMKPTAWRAADQCAGPAAMLPAHVGEAREPAGTVTVKNDQSPPRQGQIAAAGGSQPFEQINEGSLVSARVLDAV